MGSVFSDSCVDKACHLLPPFFGGGMSNPRAREKKTCSFSADKCIV